MESERRVVLMVSPHPDDEVLGAPATALALKDFGWSVINLAASLGRPEERATRELELSRASDMIGFDLLPPITKVGISSGDDLELGERQLAGEISDRLSELGPTIVISPQPHDRHHGHEVVARAVRRALELQRNPETRWWVWGLWGPLPFVNIGTSFDKDRLSQVLNALAAHASEISRNDYRRLYEGRATQNWSSGPELMFGFKGTSEGPPEREYVELLCELMLDEGRWFLGASRWVTRDNILRPPTPLDVTDWVRQTTITQRFGSPNQPVSGTVTHAHNFEDRAQLWEFRVHEDNMLAERQNFFLLAQSMLAVAFTISLSGQDERQRRIALGIGAIAFALTVAWFLVNQRQYRNVQQVQTRALEVFPWFREIHSEREKRKSWRDIKSTPIVIILVPLLAVLMWGLLFFIALFVQPVG